MPPLAHGVGRAVGVVVVTARARVTCGSRKAEDASACAARHEGAVDARGVIVAVGIDSAGGCSARWVLLVVGLAGVARCAEVVCHAGAYTARYQGPAHLRRVVVALTLDSADGSSAVGVAAVVCCAHVARSAGEPSGAGAAAATDQCSRHSCGVVVAVGLFCAWDGLAVRVPLVLDIAHVALRPNKACTAGAVTAGNVVTVHSGGVVAAVAHGRARDGRASRVALVIGATTIACCAGVARHAFARAPHNQISADAPSMAVAVEAHVARRRKARWVPTVVCRARVAL